MAALTITDQGARQLLDAAVTPRRWLRLFRNDVPVTIGSVLGDFEVATFPDYADQEITDEWSTAIIDPFGRALSTVLGVTWTRGAGGAPETIFGWLVYENEAPDSLLVAARRLNVPVEMVSEGNAVMVSIAAYLTRG